MKLNQVATRVQRSPPKDFRQKAAFVASYSKSGTKMYKFSQFQLIALVDIVLCVHESTKEKMI